MDEFIIITAVQAEAEAIGRIDGCRVVVAGLGRTNAAAATTEAIVNSGHRFVGGVISAGVAGSLPGAGADLNIGDVVVASACVYAEEGIVTAHGFADMAGLGFRLGDFEGNAVPVDEYMLERLSQRFMIGPIATVATCSGTNAAAEEVARRTGALAEAMEGAAVVHAARRLRVSAIELRTISNNTGDRAGQVWDLGAALRALGPAVRAAVEAIR
jgi:futalosine hydrolase